MGLDLANMVHSFSSLKYIPHLILGELNQMQRMTPFNKYDCLVLLESLLAIKYDQVPELYEKIFEQLKKVSPGLGTKLASRSLNTVLMYKKLFNSKDAGELAQYFTDRFTESVRSVDHLTETEVLLSTLSTERQLQAII